MTRNGASDVARRIAAKVGHPAFIYAEDGGYQVACVAWHYLTDCQRASAVAVVLPNGREFTAMPQYARHWTQPKPISL